jgi:hypothetical protein
MVHKSNMNIASGQCVTVKQLPIWRLAAQVHDADATLLRVYVAD